MSEARFIVGTGRCGSTLLSRMMGLHPEVTVIHEFFTGLDWGTRFPTGQVDGRQLGEILSVEQPVVTSVLREGLTADEIAYPFGETSRFQPGDPMPWLLVGCLPRLSVDPDGFFDEMEAWAASRPPEAIARQYRHLFAWFAGRHGTRYWIERSGSSIDSIGSLHDLFPEARFVHIHRDGCEAALSMADHPFFRIAVALVNGRVCDFEDRASIGAALSTRPPLSEVAGFWTDQVLRGFRALPGIPPEQYLEIRLEDVLDEPVKQLGAIAGFFGLDTDVDDGWLLEASALIDRPPRWRFDALDPSEREELVHWCRPGQVLLGRA